MAFGVHAQEWEALADSRADDAAALLAADRWSGAYYLAGYAVECGLKAVIARRFTAETIPARRFVEETYSHDLKRLLRLAGLEDALVERIARSSTVAGFWDTVLRWNEGSRYERWSERDARELVAAVLGAEGVLPWLRTFW